MADHVVGFVVIGKKMQSVSQLEYEMKEPLSVRAWNNIEKSWHPMEDCIAGFVLRSGIT